MDNSCYLAELREVGHRPIHPELGWRVGISQNLKMQSSSSSDITAIISVIVLFVIHIIIRIMPVF